MDNLLWIILALRSFQIFQVIRMTTVAAALLGRPPILLVFAHQFPMFQLSVHWDGLCGAQPNYSAIEFQTRLEYLHVEKRCKTVFDDCLRRGQVRWFGQPLACSLSEVQRQFWMATQAKDLHFGGDEVLQITFWYSVVVELRNCSAYADFVV